MATRPAVKRKPVARAATRTTARVVAKKPVAKKLSTTPRAAVKAPARKATARKPVATILAKNLKPVVAKKVSVVAKAKPAAATKTIAKPKKVKLVRDSFSFPEHEHELLSALKKRAKNLGKEFKKSEILRAGVAHLVAMADAALVAALDKVERVKTGRPAKKGKKK